jgi:peptide-methionine (R)-S-oxide reductase
MDVTGENRYFLAMDSKKPKIVRDWKAVLPPDVYEVTRNSGTEPPFTGKYYLEERDGVYSCSNCGTELFGSDAKYHSGSGWPSFFRPLRPDAVRELTDASHGMIRTEVRCGACDAHLGHVFPDGPRPTGLRYCINSLSLDLDSGGD